MSDFLSRLAERALGQAPVVEPLVRSRYEPGHELVTWEETSTAPLAERAKYDMTPALAAPPSAVQPRRIVPPRPQTGTAAPPAVPGTPAVREPDVEPTSAAVPRERAPDAQGRPAAQAVSAQSPRPGTAEPAPPPPASGPAADERLDAGETFAAVPVPARRRAREVDVSPLPAQAGEAAVPRTDVAWEETPPEGDSPAAVAVPARAHERPESKRVTARAAEAVQPRSTRRAQPVRSEPEPVRVTIGHVEVVAQSPPPVPAPAASAPRLSLDEYLRTRGVER